MTDNDDHAGQVRWAGSGCGYLFAEDVLDHNDGHKPHHAKSYRNFGAEHARLPAERVAAFGRFIADVPSGAYPAPAHSVPIAKVEFESFVSQVGG